MPTAAAFDNVSKLPDLGSYDRPFERRDAEMLGLVFSILGVELRYNLRARRIELREGTWGLPETMTKWTAATDRRMADLFDTIGRQFWVKTTKDPSPLYYGRTAREDALNALAHHAETDPFIEYLEALPPPQDRPLLEKFLVHAFGAPDDALTHWAGRAPFVGAIRRAYHPGAKIDEVPVLIGAQGIGKSAWVRSMLPPEHPEWHGDALNLSAPLKEQSETLAGKVIVELSELSGLRRAEIESVKTFIARADDGQHRAAYARTSETSLRRCVFVGTSNDNSPLPNDPTGNRRFVPIVLTRGIWIEDIANEARDLWWSEALAMYREGDDGRLPRQLHAVAADRAEEHRDRDDAIEDKVAGLDLSPGTMWSLNHLAPKLGWTNVPSRGEQMRLGAALKNCGWKRERTRDGEGRRVWRWKAPDA